MKSASFTRIALGLCSIFSFGCGGAPSLSDLAADEVSLTLQGFSRDPGVAAIGESVEGGLGVSRALIRTSALKLEPCDENVAALELSPRAYELTGVPAPNETITTAVRKFCGLQVDLEAREETELDGVPPETTLYVEVVDESGDSVVLSSDEALSLRFHTEPGSGFGTDPLLLGIDVSKWLADVPLEAGQSSEAGERLVAQLPAAAALFADLDGDGSLDEYERAALVNAEP